MEIIKKTSQVNTTAAKNRKIEYIVIHYTAGLSSANGKAAATAAYFAKDTTKASADFIVDDNNVVQFNPDITNRYTWHCGGSKIGSRGGQYYNRCTNKNSIGIEICSNNALNKVTAANDENWFFTDDAVLLATELTKKLMAEYNIPAENVIRHYDVTGKLCPGIVGWNPETEDESEWENFKNALLEHDDAISLDEELQPNDYNELLKAYNELKAKYDAIVQIINS